MSRRAGEAGFTLIELIISLALFALIALAGVAMVDSVLRVQAETGGRIERLGDLQRAMFVLANDIGQVTGGPVTGDATSLSFERRLGGEPKPITYRFAGGAIVREIAPRGRQRLLEGVGGIRWEYYRAGSGWLDRWPPSPATAGEWPAAIAIDIALAPKPNLPGGTLRRVVALPGQP